MAIAYRQMISLLVWHSHKITDYLLGVFLSIKWQMSVRYDRPSPLAKVQMESPHWPPHCELDKVKTPLIVNLTR